MDDYILKFLPDTTMDFWGVRQAGDTLIAYERTKDSRFVNVRFLDIPTRHSETIALDSEMACVEFLWDWDHAPTLDGEAYYRLESRFSPAGRNLFLP